MKKQCNMRKMFQSFLSFVLMVTILVSIQGIAELSRNETAMAAEAATDNIDLPGSGTEDDPFRIVTEDDIWKVTNAAQAGSLKGCYKLMGDIEITTSWLPIGSEEHPFSGVFAGNNCKVTLSGIQKATYSGFFGYNEGMIKNLFVSGHVSGVNNGFEPFYRGALVGYNSSGTIENCSTNCFVFADSAVTAFGGGLVGYNLSGEIRNCQAVGNVHVEADNHRTAYGGGLVGCNSSGVVYNCFATGNVLCRRSASSSGEYAGGLVGYDTGSSTFYGCYATGDISASCAGGLIGHSSSYQNNSPTISICCASGNVNSERSYFNTPAGGLIGEAYGVNIIDCYAIGEVKSICENDINGAPVAGGLVGYLSCSTLSHCYAIGTATVLGSNNRPGSAGGLVGGSDDSTIISSYYNNTNIGSGFGSSVSLAQMKFQSTFIDWDFNTIWAIDFISNNGYPYLRDNGLVNNNKGINSFIIPSTVNATLQKGVNFSGSISLADGKTATASEWRDIINEIKWNISNTGVVDGITCTQIESLSATNSATFMLHADAKKEGSAVITGTVNGNTVTCTVAVMEDDEDELYTTAKHVTGKLTDVNLNVMTVTVGGKTYGVRNNFSMGGAQSNLDRTVVALLLDDRVAQMDYVCDIVEPQANVSLSDASIVYEDGKFSRDSVTLKVSLTCGAKKPYWNSDLAGTEAEKETATFTGYEVELPEYLSINGSARIKKSISDTVTFGKSKDYTCKIDLDTDGYYPSKSTQVFNIRTSVFNGSGGIVETAKLAVGNLDISRKNAADKFAGSTEGQIADGLAKMLGNINHAMSENAMLDAGMNSTQIAGVQDAVNLWIANIMLTDILTKDTSDDSAWAEVWKAAGLSKREKQDFVTKLAEKAFKKIGLDISPITGASSYINIQNTPASVTIFVPYEDNNKKFYKVAVNMNMHSYAFTSNKAFAGNGDLSYTVTDNDGKQYDSSFSVGAVTYTDLSAFAESAQSLCEKKLKKIFKDNLGSNATKAKEFCRQVINETTGNKIVEAITSDTVNKIANKSFGSFSDNMFSLFYKGKLNKVPKSVTDVLCPVDVYVYDSDGNLCGSVVNNEVLYASDDIFLYVNGDEKHIVSSGSDYDIVLKGTAEGTMKYVVSEYADDELLRTLTYEDIPLTPDITYNSTVPYTQMQDSEVYNPVCDNANLTMIMPASDTKQSGVEPGGDNNNPGNDPSENPNSAADGVAVSTTGNGTETPSNDGTGNTVSQPAAKKLILSKESYIYNGKAKKPAVTVIDSNGNIITDDYYTVVYSNNKKVGKATVTVKLKNGYSGILKKNFTIKPKGTKLVSLTGKSKSISIKWAKQKTQTTGYQIQYSTSSKFSKKATVTKMVKKNTTTKLTVNKLKAKKTYYVRIRTYKTVNGKKYYSSWSKVKKVKTKK